MQCNVWEVGSDDGNGTVDQGSIGVVPDGIESKEANSCRAKHCITFVLYPHITKRRYVLGNTSPKDFARAGILHPEANLGGRGVQNPRLREISRRSKISNFSVVFEPNSKFHSPQKDVFAKHHDIFSSIDKKSVRNWLKFHRF